MLDLLTKVKNFIEENRLFDPGMTVAVGVSGGVDSVALLSILRALAPLYSLKLHVAHLNHMLRPEAGADAAFVQRLAHEWGIPVTIGYARVDRLAKFWGTGIEEAGRMARYNFLYSVGRSCGAERIAVGHHAGDQVETVLFNIMRGTGPEGIAGIPARKGKLIRPLLCVTRKEIESYCLSSNLSWRTDASNFQTDYSRNKIRHWLLPLLRREFNPNIDLAILRLANIMKEENIFFRHYISELARELLKTEKSRAVRLPLLPFLELSPAIQRRMLRLAVRLAGGRLKGLGYDHIEDCLRFLEKGATGGEIHLPNGIRVARSYKFFLVRMESGGGTPLEGVFQELAVPGETRVGSLGIAVQTEVIDRDSGPAKSDLNFGGSRYQAFFDYDKIKLPLYVRTRRPGDRIRPFGMNGTKKLKKFFGDLKIPREKRDLVPLIASDGEIYWVVGYRRSDLARITPNTRLILILRVKKLNENEEMC